MFGSRGFQRGVLVKIAGLVLTAAAGAIGSGLLAPPVAQAQGFRMGGMGMGGGTDSVDAAALEEYASILKFSTAQMDAAKVLHESYLAEFDQARKSMEDGFKKVREEFADSQDPTIWQTEMPKIMEKHEATTADIDKRFMGDLRALLNDDQAGKWSMVERAHRRSKMLPGRGMLSGESVDLIRIVKDLKLATLSETVQQSLERYAGEMDGALNERKRIREEAAKDMPGFGGRRGGGGMNFDMEAMQKAMTTLRKAGMPVRDINDRFASVIESALPTDKQEAFAAGVRKAKYPQVYAEAYASKALGAAAKFDDLTAEQKQGIADVKAAYERDAAPASQRWAAEISKAEADGGGDEMMGGIQRMMGGGSDDNDSDLAKARKARRQIDKDTLEKLKTLLTEAQKTRLPERDDPFAPGIRFGGGRR